MISLVRGFGAVVLVTAAIVSQAGCTGGRALEAYPTSTGGDPQRGKAVIEKFRCGACHVIPGIPNAHGQVGPSLADFGQRTYVAGVLPNVPANLEKWIEEPPSVDPETAMPALGVSEQQARDAAAYLYTLR